MPLTNKAPSQTSQPSQKSRDVLAAFAKDTGPAADAIAKLLQDPSPEAAKALLDDLDNLVPDDPALAAVIAEAMAGAFAVDAASSPHVSVRNRLTPRKGVNQ